jgi:2-oxo-4-hydroxy-4-carboxy-5-ureidoimidazoline decarboxylase
VLEALAAANKAYEAKFDLTFIACATGKTAPEILKLIETRLLNDREGEILAAAEEQRKITAIRIDKLLAALKAASPHSAL